MLKEKRRWIYRLDYLKLLYFRYFQFSKRKIQYKNLFPIQNKSRNNKIIIVTFFIFLLCISENSIFPIFSFQDHDIIWTSEEQNKKFPYLKYINMDKITDIFSLIFKNNKSLKNNFRSGSRAWFSNSFYQILYPFCRRIASLVQLCMHFFFFK